MNGNFAVCMFFVLSGYVLSLNYFKTGAIKVLQTAFIKRYFRLVIPILVTCMIVYVLFALSVFKNTIYPRSNETYAFGKNLFLNNLSFLEVLKMGFYKVPINGDNTYLPILWTMSVEFLGALLLFSFLLVTHTLNKKWLFYLILIFVLFLMDKNYMLLFFAGSCIAFYEPLINKLIKHWYLKICLLLAGLYFSGIPNISNEAKQYTWYFYTNSFSNLIYVHFHVIGCILLFIFFITSQTTQKIFSLKPLVFLGKLSFSLYLLHLPILFSLGSYLLNKYNGQFNTLLLFSACFSVTLISSYLFNRFVDTKAINYSSVIAKKIMAFAS